MSNGATTNAYLRPIVRGLFSVSAKRTFLIFLASALAIFFFSYVVIVYSLGLNANILNNNGIVPAYSTASVAVGILSILIAVFVIVWMMELLVYVQSYKQLIGALNTRQLFRLSGTNYLRFFFATVFQYLVAIGGLVLLVIPGLYFGVLNMFFNVTVLSERQTVYSSFRRSNYLARHAYWRSLSVFVVYLAVGLFFLYIILSIAGIGLVYRYVLASFLASYIIVAYTSSEVDLFQELAESDKAIPRQGPGYGYARLG